MVRPLASITHPTKIFFELEIVVIVTTLILVRPLTFNVKLNQNS